MTTLPRFIHLRLHSEYSIVDGIVCIEPLIETADAHHMPAVAVTDQCNLFGMVKFYQAAIAAGIKPIIGVDVWIHNEITPQQPSRAVMLCQNKQGYKNITRLISRAYIEGQNDHGIPIIKKTWLAPLAEGIIILSGGREGDVGQALLANQSCFGTKIVGSMVATFS